MKKQWVAAIALAGLAAVQARAQASESAEVRGKRVIDEAIQALGGQKFLTVRDRVETGRAYSFFQDRMNGLSVATIYTRYLSLPPDRTGTDLGLTERQAFGKNEDYYTVFNQEGAWNVTFRGFKPLAKDDVARYHDSTLHNIFYILRQRLHEPGLIIESRGMDVVENVQVETIDITDSQNRVVTVYFDHNTKLPVKQSWVWRDPDTRDRNEEITRFSRYRTDDGIQWPRQITRERNGQKIYEIFAESVNFNQDLAGDLFATPAGPATKRK
jgi:hypothetical protein